jgi:hypothetical protein
MARDMTEDLRGEPNWAGADEKGTGDIGRDSDIGVAVPVS